MRFAIFFFFLFTMRNLQNIDLEDVPDTGIVISSSHGYTETLLPDGTIDVTDCYEWEE